jgi:23S rRNA (adenine2503-C2)-methyltransferase
MLQTNFVINHIKDTMQRSEDGTVKNAVHDGLVVESVLIPLTLELPLVSSQVGCSLDCNFCATAD